MQKARPHILITNDDGIQAPGLRHLWQALRQIADVTIVAPATEQSAVGLCVTLRQPLHVHAVPGFESTKAWSVTGTPADCVKMALSIVLNKQPDLVVSGINRGTNSGRNLLYSGTVGGVIESTLRGIPGIAFSCFDYFNTDYADAAAHIPAIIEHALDHPLPHGTLLNVNFPSKEAQGIKGFKMARQGKEYWVEDPEKRSHPAEAHSYYWLGVKLAQFEEDAESDVVWLRKGFVTAVPVHVHELTDHQQVEKRKLHFDRNF